MLMGKLSGIHLSHPPSRRMVRPRLTIYVCQEPQQLRDQQKHEDGELANSTFFGKFPEAVMCFLP